MKFKYMLRGFGVGVLFSSLILAFSFYHDGNSMSDTQIMARASELGMVMPDDDQMQSGNQKLSDQLAKEAAEKNESVSEDAITISEASISEDLSTNSAKTDEESNSSLSKLLEEESVESDTHEGKNEALQDDGNEASESVSSETSTAKVVTEEQSEIDKKKLEAASEDSSKERTSNEEDENQNEDVSKEQPEKQDKKEESDHQKKDESEDDFNQPAQTVTIHVSVGMYSSQVAEDLMRLGVVSDASDFDLYMCQNNFAEKIQAGDFIIPVNATYQELAQILMRNQY